MQAADLLFDFRTESGRRGWEPTHDIAGMDAGADGLTLRIDGDDPYAVGPETRVPERQPLWLRLRMRAEMSGMGQVFFWSPGAGRGPTERESVRFAVRGGRWEEIRVPLPARPDGRIRFRIDPPGEAGTNAVLAWMTVTPRVELPEPAWPKPSMRPARGRTLRSGEATLTVGSRLGAFHVRQGDATVAYGSDHPLLGYQRAGDAPLRWLDLSRATTRVTSSRGRIRVDARATDTEGGVWTIRQEFAPGRRPGSFAVAVDVRVSRARWIASLPALALHPPGPGQDQAIFCGVEYLDRNEPSSSEADLEGEQAKRQVPDRQTHTIPLMAVLRGKRWIALEWEPSDDLAACFDTPDRRFRSGGHLLGVLFPGGHRTPGSLMPSEGRALKPGESLRAKLTLRTGDGAGNILPAVKEWVAEHGLPPVPRHGTPDDLFRLATAGWLDSGIRDGGRYRHAYPGTFAPQPAGDAALLEEWLARQFGVRDTAHAARLRDAAAAARAQAAPGDPGGVGHVGTFAGPLTRGGAAAYLVNAPRQAADLLARFQPDGTIPYRAPAGKTDYGRTHFARDANGLTAQVLAQVLEIAARTGDPAIARQALQRLRQCDARFRNTVPRGAQTWEVPLHTPDILASGHLVKAFVLGYELSGDRAFLEAARTWAWTGVPFTYLVAPSPGPIGLYGTTPVLGATGWVAPNWIGLPVQWCGLVYADAILDLARHDPRGPWGRLAEGIVASGIQQTHPQATEKTPMSGRMRQGLLPDSFNLTAQIRNDVAINPATVLVPAARTLGRPVFERVALSPGGILVHAPGRVRPRDVGSFAVDGWSDRPYDILISRLRAAPDRIRVNGHREGFRYRIGGGWVLLTVRGSVTVDLLQ